MESVSWNTIVLFIAQCYALHIFMQNVSSALLVVFVAHVMHCTFLCNMSVLPYLLCVVHIGNESCQQRTENNGYCDVCVTEIWYTCCTICSKFNDKAKILYVNLQGIHMKPTVKRTSDALYFALLHRASCFRQIISRKNVYVYLILALNLWLVNERNQVQGYVFKLWMVKSVS